MQQNVTENQIRETFIQSDVQNCIQTHELSDFRRVLIKIFYSIIYSYKSNELRGGGIYVKLPRFPTSTLFNDNKTDNTCLLWANSAHLHPVNRNPKTISNYQDFLGELDITDFDFRTSFRCSELKKIEKKIN